MASYDSWKTTEPQDDAETVPQLQDPRFWDEVDREDLPELEPLDPSGVLLFEGAGL